MGRGNRAVTRAGRKRADQAPLIVLEEIDGKPLALTPQEFSVLRAMATGLLNKEIAYDMGVSERTVDNWGYRLNRKLRARNRMHLVALAIQRGWVKDEIPFIHPRPSYQRRSRAKPKE